MHAFRLQSQNAISRDVQGMKSTQTLSSNTSPRNATSKQVSYLGRSGKQALLQSLIHGILSRKLRVFPTEVHDESFQSLRKLVIAGSLRNNPHPARSFLFAREKKSVPGKVWKPLTTAMWP